MDTSSGIAATDIHAPAPRALVVLGVIALTLMAGCTSSAPSSNSSPASNSSPSAQPNAGNAGGSLDGSWLGVTKDPQSATTEKLTFTVSNGAVLNWQGYIYGYCGGSVSLENLFIPGPAPIKSGVMVGNNKVVPEASHPENYTFSSVVGTFIGASASASGTANYVHVGNCAEPQWTWTATRQTGG